MKRNREIRWLHSIRYSITIRHNARYNGWIGWPQGFNWDEMHLTYQQLLEAHIRRLGGTPPEQADHNTLSQSLRNQSSTLNSFLASVGKSLDSSVGREFTAQFDEAVRRYLQLLAVKEKTKADRKSHLRAIRETFQSVEAAEKHGTSSRQETEFHLALRSALARQDLSPKSLARKCDASYSALCRWLKGAVPNRRARSSVHRLESALGLERGELASLVNWSDTRRLESDQLQPAIPHRVRLATNLKLKYALRDEQVTDALWGEWQQLFTYKTSRMPGLKRSAKGVWRLLPPEKASSKPHPMTCLRGQVCETAGFVWGQVTQYLGYLRLAPDLGGKGVPEGDLQTLGWLAVPEALNDFLEFITRRSGGIVHGRQRGFAGLAASMCHPTHGFLRQQPHFLEALPHKVVRNRSAEDLCDEAYRMSKAWQQAATEFSRKPEESIQGLLALTEPLAPLFRAIKKLDAEAAAMPPGGIREAVLKRDALLIAMLVSNPLRLRHFLTMQWNANNSGNLYCVEDGRWRLRFESDDFKNGRSKRQRYDAPLPRSLANRIEEYLYEYRPTLERSGAIGGSHVFLAKKGGRWETVGRHFFDLTRKLIPECSGFSPHACRHLVATDWLVKHPDDFLTVAELLNDSLDVVIKNYAHLRKDNSFQRYEAHLSSLEEKLDGTVS